MSPPFDKLRVLDGISQIEMLLDIETRIKHGENSKSRGDVRTGMSFRSVPTPSCPRKWGPRPMWAEDHEQPVEPAAPDTYLKASD